MSQMPPPPPNQPASTGGTPAASNTKTNVILAYLLWWITGLIFLFVGKDDPDVKWNAAQATVIHGIMLIGWVIFGIIIGAVTFGLTALIWNILWFVVWLVGLIMALQANGARVKFPVIGPMVANWVPMVEGWAQ